MHLEVEIAQASASRELNEKAQLPRLLWVEDEFRVVLKEAELEYVKRLIAEIKSGTLEGIAWWTTIHASDDSESIPSPTSEEWK